MTDISELCKPLLSEDVTVRSSLLSSGCFSKDMIERDPMVEFNRPFTMYVLTTRTSMALFDELLELR